MKPPRQGLGKAAFFVSFGQHVKRALLAWIDNERQSCMGTDKAYIETYSMVTSPLGSPVDVMSCIWKMWRNALAIRVFTEESPWIRICFKVSKYFYPLSLSIVFHPLKKCIDLLDWASDSLMIRLSLTQPNKSIHFWGGWKEMETQKVKKYSDSRTLLWILFGGWEPAD